MPDKGRIMSQTYYERQSKLIELYKECIIKKEMKASEVVMALRLIGFSESMASSQVREWAARSNTDEIETSRTSNKRLKQIISLEKYMLRMGFGKKYYDKYVKLLEKYKNKEISESEFRNELMQFGYSKIFTEYTIGK